MGELPNSFLPSAGIRVRLIYICTARTETCSGMHCICISLHSRRLGNSKDGMGACGTSADVHTHKPTSAEVLPLPVIMACLPTTLVFSSAVLITSLRTRHSRRCQGFPEYPHSQYAY